MVNGPRRPDRKKESMMASYDDDNIFAKILRKEIPSFKVYEDDKTYCFMDII